MGSRREKVVPLKAFTVACDLLNGDLPIPKAARSGSSPTQAEEHLDTAIHAALMNDLQTAAVVARGEKLAENASSLTALLELYVPVSPWGRPSPWGRRGVPCISESDRARRALFKRLAPEGLTREDVEKLAECCRFRLRGQSLLRAIHKRSEDRPFAEFVFNPFETGRWPRPAVGEPKALMKWFNSRSEAFLLFVETCRRWFGESWGNMLLTALTQRPRTFEDAHVCLLAAYLLSAWDSEGRLPLRACLACHHFFVAGKPNRETCSDRCRQRLYRGTQDEAGRTRLRKQAKEYKRAQRREEAERNRREDQERKPKAPARKPAPVKKKRPRRRPG